MKRPVRKIVDYLILSLIVSLAIVLMLIYNGNKTYQFFTILGLSALYVLWGLMHHTKEGTLNSKIALEYVLFALFGMVLVYGLL